MTNKRTLSLSSVVARNAGVIEAEIESKVVAMNIETGNCYGLNEVGSRIWNLIVAPISISGVCTQLIVEFEIEPEICEREVLALLQELRAEDLVEVFQGT